MASSSNNGQNSIPGPGQLDEDHISFLSAAEIQPVTSNTESHYWQATNPPLVQIVPQRPSFHGLRTPSIRIRRVNSSNFSPNSSSQENNPNSSVSRPRSLSDPAPPNNSHSNTLLLSQTRDGSLNLKPMPTVSEESSLSHGATVIGNETLDNPHAAVPAQNVNLDAENTGGIFDSDEDLYESDIVDRLDLLDPEISTLTTLNNVQNSLFLPNLGPLFNRNPVYNLSPLVKATPAAARRLMKAQKTRRKKQQKLEKAEKEQQKQQPPILPDESQVVEPVEEQDEDDFSRQPPPLTHSSTISSVIVKGKYAVLPHGKKLSGWTPGEKHELDDHVRHMLHSRRSKFKRIMKGFWQYVKRPLGFFITLYAFLITIFGLIWVLFLIGWINVGGKKLYVVNVIDTTLVVLFNIMGWGLAPFRAYDTYNAVPIVYYHIKEWRLRKKLALPKLENPNDLPINREEDIGNHEAVANGDFIVLSEKQQANLTKHETRYSKSHTFYKPHETYTHFAFPIAFVVAIQTLLDLHSMFQIALGGVTYGINYKHRPFKATTALLCCSISCNITAGILISIGDHRTRKKQVIEQMERQELTSEAIRKVEKKRIKQLAKEEEELREEAEAKQLTPVPEIDDTAEQKPGSSQTLSENDLHPKVE